MAIGILFESKEFLILGIDFVLCRYFYSVFVWFLKGAKTEQL